MLNFPGFFSREFKEKLDIVPEKWLTAQNKRTDGGQVAMEEFLSVPV